MSKLQLNGILISSNTAKHLYFDVIENMGRSIEDDFYEATVVEIEKGLCKQLGIMYEGEKFMDAEPIITGMLTEAEAHGFCKALQLFAAGTLSMIGE